MFLASTMVMTPAYTLLLTTSKVKWAFRIVTSHALPFLLSVGWLTGMLTAGADTWASVSLLESHSGGLRANVAAFAQLFQDKWFTTITWLHLLMLDFVLAREVALDASEHGVFAMHSVLLCFMCGPVGFLAHKLTKAFLRRPGPATV